MSTQHRTNRPIRLPFHSGMVDASTSFGDSASPEKSGDSGRSRIESWVRKVERPNKTQRTRQPELNLVTRFSNAGSKAGISRFSSKQYREMLQERRRKSTKTKPALGHTKTPSGVSKLSPSDGMLLIGLSLEGVTDKVYGKGSPDNLHQHQTPEIIVTPAKEDAPWSAGDGLLKPSRRPTSSVYTRRTQFGISMAPSPAPPVPAFPNRSPIVPERNPYRRSSVDSWISTMTMDDGMMESGRRFSSESHRYILDPEILSSPGRRRSTGWWNTVLSPFLDRKMTFTTSERSPANEHAKEMKDAATSPMPDKDAVGSKRSSAPSSVWPDGRWEAERRTLGFFHDESPREDLNRQVGLHRGEMVASPEAVAHARPGEAAEYYRACWHDQIYLNPYFECQNHDCGKGGAERGLPFDPENSADARGIGGERGLKSVEAGEGSAAAIASKALEDGSVEKKRDASQSPQVRQAGGVSVIDEEPTGASKHGSPNPPAMKASPPLSHHSPPLAQDTSRSLVNLAANTPAPAPAPSAYDLANYHAPPPPPPIQTAPPTIVTRSTDPVSPGAMTPGLRHDVQSHKAMPMEATRAPPATAISASDTRDPLQINEPRVAPIPPAQVRREISPDRGLALAPIDSPARSERTTPRTVQEGSRVDERREVAQAPNPVVINKWFRDNQERHQQDDTAKAPTFAPPPRAETKKMAYKKSFDEPPEKEKSAGSKLAIFKRLFTKQPKTKRQKRRTCLFCMIFSGLLALILLILALVLTLTLKRDDIPAQTSWLNITGYPPIPTGIATIARPNAVDENDKCVQPPTLWSCAVPKEQQQSISPNAPDQPNFRISIRYQNGSAPTNATKAKRWLGSASSFGVADRLLHRRDGFSDSLFSPNPAPPSADDQNFLGKTTDNITAPFAGDQTPFFLSFLPTTTTVTKRSLLPRAPQPQTSTSSNSSADAFPNITANIPPPPTEPDGTAAAATLLPLPSAQPLRLYNRGRPDEHYGFYTYFDRSIFLASDALLNDSSAGPVPGDLNGGAAETAARMRCTWTQTRFLVQIWTRALPGAASLLPRDTNNTSSSSGNGKASSLNDFSRPGSFPYPVSVTLDRHGGAPDAKMIYCYAVDERAHLVAARRQIHIELRNATGALVNPSQGLFGTTTVATSQGGPGGIDGGTGGCRCQWQNFQAK